MEINQEKSRIHELLKEAEEKAREAEIKAEEQETKRNGLQELLDTLKQGSATAQVLEWQKKLEDLRLRDLRSKRLADQMSQEVDHLTSINKGLTLRLEQCEEELIRIENRAEQRQLEWEKREMDLELLVNEDHGQSLSGKVLKESKVEDQVDLIPDSSLPLAKQLEQALKNLRQSLVKIDDYKTKMGETKILIEELQKKLKDKGELNIANVNELTAGHD